jgi:hypothetical protein
MPATSASSVRWASRGDTIETVQPIHHGPQGCQHLRVRLDTPEACGYGNQLIAAGTWRVVEELSPRK